MFEQEHLLFSFSSKSTSMLCDWENDGWDCVKVVIVIDCWSGDGDGECSDSSDVGAVVGDVAGSDNWDDDGSVGDEGGDVAVGVIGADDSNNDSVDGDDDNIILEDWYVSIVTVTCDNNEFYFSLSEKFRWCCKITL